MTENSERIIGILIKDSEDSGSQAFPVRQGFPLTIGRAPDNDVYLSDMMVKRHHCQIYVEGEQVYLMAGATLHSHVWINGTEVRDNCQLKFGDVIVVGQTVFRFSQPASSSVEDNAPERGEA